MTANRKQSQRRPKQGKPKLRVIGVPPNPDHPDFTPADHEYFRELHKVIDKIFDEAANQFQWTWGQLADHANLCCLTVSNLGDRVTIYPRYMTVYKLAQAVGWQLVVEAKKDRKTSKAKMAVS